MRGKNGKHEFDGVGQLDGDDRICRQAGLDEVGGKRRDGPIGLAECQAFCSLPRDERLVERIQQRRRIRLARQDPAKQSVERRR